MKRREVGAATSSGTRPNPVAADKEEEDKEEEEVEVNEGGDEGSLEFLARPMIPSSSGTFHSSAWQSLQRKVAVLALLPLAPWRWRRWEESEGISRRLVEKEEDDEDSIRRKAMHSSPMPAATTSLRARSK